MENTIFENIAVGVIVALVLSVGFIAVFVKKANNTIESLLVGIDRIYKEGRNINKIKKSMGLARCIYFIVYAGDAFIQTNHELLSQSFQRGLDIKLLVGEPRSDFLHDAAKIDGLALDHYDHKITDVIDEFKTYPSGKGTIEVRSFSTELRNPMIICKMNDTETIAWITLFIPPKRAADCIMLEFTKKKKTDELQAYFDIIWSEHSNNILYKS